VTVEAKLVGWLSQLGRIRSSMNVVAGGASHAAPVHQALDEIIALHSIFVGRTVGEVKEVGLPERAVFQFPEVGEAKSNVVADRPIVILAFQWNRERAALRMALNAGIGGGNRIHLRWINDVAASGMCSVFSAGAVTTFAAYIPFGDLLGMNVIANGVTPIAGWTGWALHVVVGIVLRPPVGAGRWHFIRFPFPGSDNPLRGQRKVIVTDFGEVALLPDGTVNERDLIFGEL